MIFVCLRTTLSIEVNQIHIDHIRYKYIFYANSVTLKSGITNEKNVVCQFSCVLLCIWFHMKLLLSVYHESFV